MEILIKKNLKTDNWQLDLITEIKLLKTEQREPKTTNCKLKT